MDRVKDLIKQLKTVQEYELYERWIFEELNHQASEYNNYKLAHKRQEDEIKYLKNSKQLLADRIAETMEENQTLREHIRNRELYIVQFYYYDYNDTSDEESPRMCDDNVQISNISYHSKYENAEKKQRELQLKELKERNNNYFDEKGNLKKEYAQTDLVKLLRKEKFYHEYNIETNNYE